MSKSKGKGKKGNDKGKGKKKGKGKGDAEATAVVKKLLKTYEKNCSLSSSQVSPHVRKALKSAITDEKVVTKFIFESMMVENEGDLPVLFEPLIMTLRQERYTYIRDLYVWDYPISYENIANFSLFLERPYYKLRLLELMDCLIEPLSISRFSRVFCLQDQLTTLNLDYNEFGDEGAKYLSEGLKGNTTMLSLSLCFCGLGVTSGTYLGYVISTTAVRELYLDGNNLQCEGATELIKLCVDQAEVEASQREEEVLRKAEEEALRLQEEKENRYRSGTELSEGESTDAKSPPGSAKKKKKKKKGKKKKKKGPPPPPPVGPWVYKLHLADNGIDNLGEGGSFAPIICMRLFKKLLMNSMCLEEFDLEDNLIGDVGGRELADGLTYRKEQKMPGVKVRVTHRMCTDTFNMIVKLGSGLKKKKKGRRGKKKKK
ncbi:uncharacterized protein LOC112576910 isoform X2 [Pomacea canaliculata]|uniref:uncharacterized protein LOC112576910 isoform X2 n=1 Tax=Pomacea canaliculata TaxID=400727 RepID=UPI000D735B8E|nr:uncharacterized protein LOC112576910 isoform X2 [Pomacea canaliculata]